jgi:3-hydroxyisobutyrate dehydrogenase-like beta-hydroxyacid dehydrogenase
MNIGLIGLGNMGSRIAKRLLTSDCQLWVYDINETILSSYQKLGANIAKSPLELASNTSYILTILPNADSVKEVVLGNDGLLEGLQTGSVLIDITSSEPKTTKYISEVLKKVNVHMIDAPVSGGIKKAENGTLSIMVGGEEQVLQSVLPLLKHIGTTITYIGDHGSGHAMKALNNLVSATTLSITAEAVAIGAEMGLDPVKMIEVINNSSGRSNSSEVKFPEQILNGKFEVSFPIELMYKDLTTALNMAKDTNISVDVSESVHQLWGNAVSDGFNRQDHTAIVKFMEQKRIVEKSN